MAGSTGAVTYVCSDGQIFTDLHEAFRHERRDLLRNAIKWNSCTTNDRHMVLSLIMHNAATIEAALTQTIKLGIRVPSSTQDTEQS